MPRSCASSRGRDTDVPNTSSIVWSFTIGSVGSIDWTTRRICGASESNGSSDRTTTFRLRGAGAPAWAACSLRK